MTGKLHSAIESFLLACANRTINDPYSHIEIPKMAIADALLELLKLPTKPTSAPLEPGHAPKPPPRPPTLGFVYLAKNYRNGYYKIGFSTRPAIRERTLQAEDPDTRFILKVRGTKVEETILHLNYAAFRLRGEWFQLDAQEAKEAVSLLRKMGVAR